MSQDAAPAVAASSTTSVTTEQEQVALASTDERPMSSGKDSVLASKEKVEKAAVEVEEDDWETDPDNARNWSSRKKWTAVFIVSLYTFVSPLASSMMAPGLEEVAEKYHITSATVAALTLSIYLLSFALGPLFLAPLSEMYGRTWVLHIGNMFSLAFTLGCAFAPTASSLIAFRFLAGFSGSAPIACGGGSVGDLFSERDRASAMAVYSLGPLVGPVVGPIAGGFIAQSIGVKWVFIVICILCGFASVIGITLLRETYGPVIRLRKAAKTGDPEAVARIYRVANVREKSFAFMWENLSRPYGFSPGIGGLCYIGLGIGFILATLFGAKTADNVYKYLADKNGGKGKPEMRIPALFFGSFFVPIGLLYVQRSNEALAALIKPLAGMMSSLYVLIRLYLVAYLTRVLSLPIQLYLVDAFRYAASATAAASVFRSMLGFAFPLFGEQMFHALGLGGGNSLLAGLAIVLGIPFPIWIYYRGEAIRVNSKVQL
ncbi:hypothetical protein H0H92_002161 [Tricholoma furcatifolium]|nr:hypothetical protein H0H92_002161 [Tricholoma furcatifolium]